MHYSETEGHCRVDFFKSPGKWYTTEVIDMTDLYNHHSLHDAVAIAVNKAVGSSYQGMAVVVLEPYHVNAHPVLYQQ